jgi:hypothetical protein
MNPWIEICPICGCQNPKFDPNISAPATFQELLQRGSS